VRRARKSPRLNVEGVLERLEAGVHAPLESREAALVRLLSVATVLRSRRIITSSNCGDDAVSVRRYGAGAAVAAFHRRTTDAVVVLSVFLNPGTGSFEYRSRYPIFNARRAFIAACAVTSASDR